jgi:ornithine cyclodeaminase/alanine dehydrogenase-like protein (mu-crystallin family)
LTTNDDRMPAVLDLPALIGAVTLPEAVTAVEEAFRALAHRTVLQPAPTSLGLPGGEVHVKSAQLGPGQPVVVKVATGFAGNAARRLPPGDGAMVVLHPDTGQVRAVLLDHGWLTDVRTAAATAVAVRHLAGPTPRRRLALLGTGVQADLTLSTLATVGLLPAETAVWGRNLAAARRLAGQHVETGGRISATSSAQHAVEGADLVITVTAARSPVLSGAWLAPDALVVAVGADTRGKRECDAQVLTRATRIVVDSLQQATRLGELQHAPTSRLNAPVVDLADLVAAPTGPHADGIQVCDLTGVGATDAAIAAVALNNSRPGH